MGGQSPVNDRRVGGKHNIVNQADSGLGGWMLRNFPQFIVIHTVKGFGIVNKAEIEVFLELSWFLYDSTDIGNLISIPLPFLKPA